MWLLLDSPGIDACAEKCLEDDACLGFYRWITKEEGRTKCVGLNDIGDGVGVLTELKDWYAQALAYANYNCHLVS